MGWKINLSSFCCLVADYKKKVTSRRKRAQQKSWWNPLFHWSSQWLKRNESPSLSCLTTVELHYCRAPSSYRKKKETLPFPSSTIDKKERRGKRRRSRAELTTRIPPSSRFRPQPTLLPEQRRRIQDVATVISFREKSTCFAIAGVCEEKIPAGLGNT